MTRAEELPPLGALPEDLQFDMKAQPGTAPDPPEAQLFEIAKDMAAFANATGGTILVGARESNGQLIEYVAMDAARADAAVRAFNTALQRCSPRPVIDPRVR